MKKIILFALMFCAVSCGNKVIDIKSPCVSAEDGPCGPKKPINDWWLNSKQNS